MRRWNKAKLILIVLFGVVWAVSTIVLDMMHAEWWVNTLTAIGIIFTTLLLLRQEREAQKRDGEERDEHQDGKS